MDNPGVVPGGKPKKSSLKFKLILYALALVGLVWVGLQGYWEFFKFKIWLGGFWTGFVGTVGLICGFIYFYSVHKIHERIKIMPEKVERFGSYIAFSLGLLVLNPLTISLALWMFTPPSTLNTANQWFFWGCAIGSGIVLLLERLFAKKTTKP